MKIEKIKRSSKLLLTILVVSIFMLFLSVSISYKQFKSVTVSEKLVVHSHKVIQTLQELTSYVKDGETAQRGYLLTQDPAFLTIYTNSFNKVNQTIDDFNALTPNSIEQQKNIDSLLNLIYNRFQMLAATLKNVNIESPLSESDKKRLLSGKDIMDKIRIESTEIINFETQKLKKREDAHLEEVKISPIAFLFTAFFSLLVFIVAFYKIFKDISTLKTANNQLLINKALFGHNESIAKISSWWWNIEENKIVYSDNHYRLLGCEPNEFELSVDKFLEFVHPEDRHIITDGEQEVTKGLTTSTAFYRIIRKDGEIRYFKSIGKIITDNYGKKIAIGINADITEEYFTKKILEEKLFDLERSNQELQAFNHVASHDLQEPLRKIQTFISRIDEKEVDALSENGKNYFSRIKVAANRMQILIDDLLAFSRTNKVEKAFQLTDLNILLENSIQELAQSIEDKKATIHISQLPTVNVIPFQIQQLFINLIGNSLKYRKPDVFPIITISSEIICGKNLINSSFSSENKLYKISISDNGIGFDQKYAEEIFTLFNRLHSNNEYSGTGIGLTICKKITENHKGFITAESIPNVGSRFNIFLPVSI